MSKVITSILLYPCLSMASADAVNATTDIKMCPDTVKVEYREIAGINYGYYRNNFFRLRKVMFVKGNKTILR